MTSLISLPGIRVYAYHGCLEEEARIGSEYRVDLKTWANFGPSYQSDELRDTVDYVWLNRLVVEEMAVRSKLLEHVAYRIMQRLFAEDPRLDKAEVAVTKINPPLGGDVKEVTVILKGRRKDFAH